MVYRRDLQAARYADLHTDTRLLNDVLIDLAPAASPAPDRERGMELLGQGLALAHGYATLNALGGLSLRGSRPEETVTRAAKATRVLLAGHVEQLGAGPVTRRSSSRGGGGRGSP